MMRGSTTFGSLVLDLPQDLEDETVVILRAPAPPSLTPLRVSKAPALRPAFVCKRTPLGPSPPSLDQLADVETQTMMGLASGVQLHARTVETVGNRPTLLLEASFDTPGGRVRQVHATTIIGRSALSFAATATDDAAFPSVRAQLLVLVASARLA
jgi:hypothetical protein